MHRCRQIWGIGAPRPLDFQHFFLIHFGAIYKVWRWSLVPNIPRMLTTTVIKISTFFIFIEKWKRYRFFCNTVYMYFVSFYVCDLSYINVVLCPCSPHILATTLLVHCTEFSPRGWRWMPSRPAFLSPWPLSVACKVPGDLFVFQQHTASACTAHETAASTIQQIHFKKLTKLK